MIATAANPTDVILSKVEGVKQTADGWMALCPAHNDRNPSLHISIGDGGRVLLRCHAGCATQSILAAMGLGMSDLFPPRESSNGNGNGKHRNPGQRPKATFISAAAAIQQAAAWAKVPSDWRLKVHDYPKNGQEYAKMARWDDPHGTAKTLRPLHKAADRWIVGDPPGGWPPYTQGHELPASGPIVGAEGEKCCELFWSLGLPCFATAHGASSLRLTDLSGVHDREVWLFPDNDDAGSKYMAEVAAILTGQRCRVKIVPLPDLPSGGDIVDYDAAIGSTPESTRHAVEELAEAADFIAVGESDSPPQEEFRPISLVELSKQYSELREIIIGGLLRRGQVGNLVSTSKAYKTFLMLMLAVCMVLRRCWLDVFTTAGGRVLVIDLELQQPDLVKRLADIFHAMGAPREIMDRIDVLSFRGRNGDINHLEKMLLAMAPRTYDLVILDPLYKSYPPDFDENSNAQMTGLYRRFERIAEHLDCALLIVHHATKGSQSEKRVVDVGAGAGSQARSADCHIALREHEIEGAVVFDAKVRSFKPPEPFVMDFNYPLWRRNEALSPSDLKTGKSSRNTEKAQPLPEDNAEPMWTVDSFVGAFFTDHPQDKKTIVARARQARVKNREVDDLIALALAEKKAFVWTYPKNRAIYIANVAQPVILSGEMK